MWVRVDFATLLDAIDIADDHGERIRVRSQDDLIAYAARSGPVTLHTLLAPTLCGCHAPNAAIVSAGLYEGVYRYSMDDQVAFRWMGASTPTYPLRTFTAGEMLDVAISYSGRSWHTHAKPLLDALTEAGLRVYAIPHTDEPTLRAKMIADPLWRVRYREGLCHSRYFVPICSPAYLDAAGSREEMAELARVTVKHRSTEHFYPIIPWFPPDSAPLELIAGWKSLPPDQIDRHLESYDQGAFAWVRHLFPFPQDWSFAEVAELLIALCEASRALVRDAPLPDARYLELLTREVSTVERLSSGVARVGIRHPWWPDRAQVFSIYLGTGKAQWVGTGPDEGDQGTPPEWFEILDILDPARAPSADRLQDQIRQPPEPRLQRVGDWCLPDRLACAHGKNAVLSVAIDPSARRLAVGLERDTVVFDLQTGARSAAWPRGSRSLCFTPSGELLALGEDRLVRWAPDGSATEVACAADWALSTNTDGRRIVAGGVLGSCLVFEHDLSQVASFRAAPSQRIHPRLSPDGQFIVIASAAGLRLHAATGRLIAVLETASCNHVSFVDDDTVVATLTKGAVRTYALSTLSQSAGTAISGMTLGAWPLPDGDVMVRIAHVETERSSFARWSPRSGAVRALPGYVLRPTTIACHAASGLVVCGRRSTVHLWTTEGDPDRTGSSPT